MRFSLLILSLLIVIPAFSQSESNMPIKPALDLSLMDPSVNPADDFFRYVNGTWMEQVDIPADRERWGSFDELRKNTDANTLKVLETAIASGKYGKDTDQGKAALFYQTGMDVTHINANGAQPIQPYLDRVDQLRTIEDLQAILVDLKWAGAGPFVDFGVSPDLKNSSVYSIYIGTGDLGLPERDYYVKDDSASVALRDAYQEHVAKMLGMIGQDPERAQSAARRILDLETRMAESLMTKEERRNPYSRYHPKSLAELRELVPSFDWKAYFQPFELTDREMFVVSQPAYLTRLESLLVNNQVESWKDYLRWTIINGAADFLSADFEEANFDFYGKTLRGLQSMKPRHERVLGMVNNTLGEALGKLYVDAYFPPAAKEKAVDMVQNILEAFDDRIRALDWMSDTTKEKAIQKLATFTVKIGYPDKWKDYSGLEVTGFGEGGSYFQNVIKATRWNFEDDLSKLDREVDRTEWFMSPQVVNAYYNPLYNEIVFPAAILQPPFYYFEADEAVNFGGIGAVIGHEISHGFDDQGSQFDEAGNLNNWWTDGDRERFVARNRKLIDQFNEFEPIPGLHVNGEFTLGENIGDLGGANVAYSGLQKYYEKHGRPGLIDGFTGEQRFFLSWGTIWRTKIRDEALKTLIATDSHSPGQYRAIGPLVNMPEFYEAFDVKEGDAMYRNEESRVKIW
ncbi:MAG: M13 family metallopeptidase [Saprospiraceae bacterium]|nr:M13 family metallopeptidase [Saprospiraceae bacterium]